MPETLEVKLEFGWTRTSKQQREQAEIASEEYGEINAKINEILNEKQGQRLKQIWNQIVIEMGWKQVPLAFPDWRDYLELTDSQREKFDQINQEFTDEIRQLHADHIANRKQAVEDFNQVVRELLTEDQKQTFRKFLGNRL